MGVMGSGNGTLYPDGIDTNTQPETTTSSVRAAIPNDLYAATVAIEGELGIAPSGSAATVRARLDQGHLTSGAHKNYIDAADYTTFTQAVSAAANKTLVFYSTITLTAAEGAVTVPATVSLLPMNPGVIAKGTATSLTILGPVVGNPMHQWLSGFAAGDVTGLKEGLVDWFGAKGDGIVTGAVNTAAIGVLVSALSVTNGVPTFNFAPNGRYLIAGAIGANFNKAMIVRFNGSYLDYEGGTGKACIFGGASGVSIQDITGYDVWVTGTDEANGMGVVIQNLSRSNFYGIRSNQTGKAMAVLSVGGGGVYFNNYYGVKLYNAHKDLYIDCELNVNGYITAQRFFGGNIYGTLPTPAGSRGVEITDTNDANDQVSKIGFYGTAIEPVVGTTTGRKVLDKGYGNMYFDVIWDISTGAPGTDIEFTANSKFNEIYGGTNTYLQIITDSGLSNSINAPNLGISVSAGASIASNIIAKMRKVSAGGGIEVQIKNASATQSSSVAIKTQAIDSNGATQTIGLIDFVKTNVGTDAFVAGKLTVYVADSVGDVQDRLIIDGKGSLSLPTTVGAFSPPILTTTQKNALTPVNGMIVYDSTLGKFQGYEAGAWTSFV